MAASRRGFLASTFLAPLCRGQQAVFSTGVSVVNVLATVRDGKGRLVVDLAQDDFILEEEHRRQQIRYFSRQTELPLVIGLLVDTSMSQMRVLEQERKASRRFLGRTLRPEDLAFLIKFDREVELLRDVTSSRQELEAALDLLETPVRTRRPRSGPTLGRGARRAGTALYDAVLLASDELMQKQQGRKALIVLTDGVDAGSKVSLNSAIEFAQRADTLLYSIRIFDKDAYDFRRVRGSALPDGRKALTEMSEETGGSIFEMNRSLDEIFDRIEEELRNQYNLGYKPDPLPPPGRFRNIRLTTRRNGLQVQTRKGYYSPKA